MKFLVTGAGGFLGSKFIEVATKKNHLAVPLNLKYEQKLDFCKHDFKEDSFDCLVHFAGLAHRKNYQPDQIYDVNINFPLSLAKICILKKIKKFIFISSIGVHGSFSQKDHPINEDSRYAPENIYGYSKLLAERELKNILKDSNCDLTILRPPLIFGKYAKGNWSKLKKYIFSGLPFPDLFSNVKKSLISVDELCNVILISSSKFNLKKTSYVVSHPYPISFGSIVDSLYLTKFHHSRRFVLSLKCSNFLNKFNLPLVSNLNKELIVEPISLIKDINWSPSNKDLSTQIIESEIK